MFLHRSERKESFNNSSVKERIEITELFFERAIMPRDETTETNLVGILDLIFIHGIPRRQESRAIKHSLSFDESAVRNVKGMTITAVYAV